jgi:hypothetical protein
MKERKADPSVFVMRQERRDDFVSAAKLLMSMTFAARSLLAPDNQADPLGMTAHLL